MTSIRIQGEYFEIKERGRSSGTLSKSESRPKFFAWFLSYIVPNQNVGKLGLLDNLNVVTFT